MNGSPVSAEWARYWIEHHKRMNIDMAAFFGFLMSVVCDGRSEDIADPMPAAGPYTKQHLNWLLFRVLFNRDETAQHVMRRNLDLQMKGAFKREEPKH